MDNISYDIDTYIEMCFKKKCEESSLGCNLFSNWQTLKHRYIDYTKTTVYEFMNYSLHDSSHSINILENIESVLGQDRVNLLSRSDLWLLLNVAYSHDVGMAAEYKDLEQLWSDNNFRDYLREMKSSYDQEESRTAKNYFYFEWLLDRADYRRRPKELDEDMQAFEYHKIDAWPLEFRRDITLLMSSYIRKLHAQRSEKYFNQETELCISLIPERLYKMIGHIDGLHLREFDDIIKEESKICKGVGRDSVHPRFIAILLRIGDLLDLDNNRFDFFNMKHFGPMPKASIDNLEKHKAIKHFMICPKKIEITAESDDFDACRMTFSWFHMLEEEIKNLILYWSVIAPEKLSGCLMGLPELQVFHKGWKFNNQHIKTFNMNREKLMQLFTGNNLYNSKLEFIREYVQNSLDANRIQLWYELRDLEIQRELFLKKDCPCLEEVRPFDLKKQAFDAFPVYIRIKEKEDDHSKFIMEIEDEGIGMDLEGIYAIANIGSGWRKREKYTKDINSMQQWFKPTGGFGVGIQSAFMMTDMVQIETKETFDCGYKFTIYQYSKNNNILIEVHKKNLKRGTKVSLEISFDKFLLEEIYENNYHVEFTGYYFDYYSKLEFVYSIIKEYLLEQFPNTLMPIRLELYPRRMEYIVQSEYFFRDNQTPDFKEMNELNIIPWKDEYQNTMVYCDSKKPICLIWDKRYQALFYFDMPKSPEKLKVMANYKNVRVGDNCKEVFYHKNAALTLKKYY